jgi:Ion channel
MIFLPHRNSIQPVPSAELGVYRHSVLIFLGAVVLFVVAMPFGQYLSDPGLLEGILLTVVLTSGVLAVGGRRNSLLLAAALAIPALVARWLWHYWSDPLLYGLSLALGTLLLLQVTMHLLRFIVRAPRVDAEVLAAGVATYLVIGLVWAMLYLLIGFLEPNAYQLAVGKALDPFNALYFSFVTLTTIGYGDISPVAPIARMLAMLEAVTGVLFPAVLIARLVSMYTGRQD